VFVRLYASTSVQSPCHMSESSQKVGKGSTKPPGFTMPHYFYIYSISTCDSGVIQTPRAEIYIFTMGAPYKISRRILVFASLWTGIFTVECACPEPFGPPVHNLRALLRAERVY
jgi:hypothetical protein